MFHFTRPPRPELRTVVERIWIRAVPTLSPSRERVLPTGGVHLAIRIPGPGFPETGFRYFQSDHDETGVDLGPAIVGGARSAPYLKETGSASLSVGAQLVPGWAPALLGLPTDLVSEQHVSLDRVWSRTGSLAVGWCELEPHAILSRFEETLIARLDFDWRPHPAALEGLRLIADGVDVATIVRRVGYSHRRFVTLFRESVGSSPKVYERLRRLQTALRLLRGDRGVGGKHRVTSLAEVALEAGYCDQPHFNREFRRLTGLSPGAYRRAAPKASHHLPR